MKHLLPRYIPPTPQVTTPHTPSEPDSLGALRRRERLHRPLRSDGLRLAGSVREELQRLGCEELRNLLKCLFIGMADTWLAGEKKRRQGRIPPLFSVLFLLLPLLPPSVPRAAARTGSHDNRGDSYQRYHQHPTLLNASSGRGRWPGGKPCQKIAQGIQPRRAHKPGRFGWESPGFVRELDDQHLCIFRKNCLVLPDHPSRV